MSLAEIVSNLYNDSSLEHNITRLSNDPPRILQTAYQLLKYIAQGLAVVLVLYVGVSIFIALDTCVRTTSLNYLSLPDLIITAIYIFTDLTWAANWCSLGIAWFLILQSLLENGLPEAAIMKGWTNLEWPGRNRLWKITKGAFWLWVDVVEGIAWVVAWGLVRWCLSLEPREEGMEYT